MVRQTRWSRAASIALARVVIATNLVALGMLVRTLTSPATEGTAQGTVREVAVGSAG